MDFELAQKAVNLALTGNWKEAVALNKQILKGSPKDIEALNRLARASAELGEIKNAKTASEKVLRLDPTNTIAIKCLAKWKSIKGKGLPISSPTIPSAFLEEPGKTKLVELLHPGDPAVLAKLDAGDAVVLSPHAHRVNVTAIDGEYLGRLPDDLAARLRKLIKLGNQYKVFIKSIQDKDIKIFIKEVARSQEAMDFPSFPKESVLPPLGKV